MYTGRSSTFVCVFIIEDGAASAVAAGIAVGLAAIGPGIGQGQAAAYRLRMNLGIQVLLYDVRGLLLLSFAFMESLCIYGLVEHSCWWRLHQVDLQHLSSPSRCYVCWVGGVTIRRRLDSYLAVFILRQRCYQGHRNRECCIRIHSPVGPSSSTLGESIVWVWRQ